MFQNDPIFVNERKKNIRYDATRAGQSVPKDSGGWNDGKTSKEPAQVRGVGGSPLDSGWGREKVSGHPPTAPLTASLLGKCCK